MFVSQPLISAFLFFSFLLFSSLLFYLWLVLNVDGNPLRTPPKEIVKKGRKEIMGYLKDLAKGSEQCYRVKLMVVGQENVGKTTLIRKLNQKKRRTVRRSSKAPDMNVSTGE